MITQELTAANKEHQNWIADFENSWSMFREAAYLPSFTVHDEEDVVEQEQRMTATFDKVSASLKSAADQGNKLEGKLKLHYGGYQTRAKNLRSKIVEAASALEEVKTELDAFQMLQISEQSALSFRLEKLRDEVTFVTRKEREAQESYKNRREELETHINESMNGWH
jgi:pre-mRNA-splicing factor CDC5/CEF1